jgi:hypothetical protein
MYLNVDSASFSWVLAPLLFTAVLLQICYHHIRLNFDYYELRISYNYLLRAEIPGVARDSR